MDYIRTNDGETVKTYATPAGAKRAAYKQNFVTDVHCFRLIGGRWLPVVEMTTGAKDFEKVLLGNRINYCI